MTTVHIHTAMPGREHKAAREARAAGAGAIVPLDRTGPRARVTAPGYVAVDAPIQTPFARFLRAAIGTAHLADVMRLFQFPQERRAEEVCPFNIGDVVLLGLVPAKVVAISGRIARVEFQMAGKTHTQSIAYTKLRPG